MTVPEVDPAEVEVLLEDDADVRVVDIRPPAAFRRGHLPGSENVPLPELATGVPDLAGADRVVTVCPHGRDSVRAARLVSSFEGIDARVESMAGGLAAWDGPLVDGTADGAGDGAPF